MKLYTEIRGQGSDIVFLHGLFGDGRNLLNIAKALETSEQKRRCILIDHRNHGNSPHADGFSYKLMASDLAETFKEINVSNPLIIGHSMGAKVAMEYTLQNPGRVKGLVCMDSAAGKYKPRYSTFVNTMKELIPESIRSRKEAEQFFISNGIDAIEARFLLKNLIRSPQGAPDTFTWRINLAAIAANYHHIWESIAPGRHYDGPVLFLKGENSNFISLKDEDYIRELFPKADIKTIPNAGHWLHIDNPTECIAVLNEFLDVFNS